MKPSGLLVCLAALTASAWMSASAQDAEAPRPESPAPSVSRVGSLVVVVLVGGQRITGELTQETPTHIAIKIANVETRIPRDQVERVITQPSPAERYREMRAIIDDKDVERLLLLIDWLRDRELFDEALLEVEHVLNLEPQNGEALRLRQLIEQQKALAERRRADEGVDEEPAEAPPQRGPGAPAFPMLTEEQINFMKVMEVDLSNPPRLLVDRETVRKFLDAYAGAPGAPTTRDGRAAFERKPAVEVLRAMFEARAREFYGSVQVQGVPLSMRLFRDHVQTAWLVNSCATTRCHGGEEAGRLALANRNPASDAATFTNFYILDRSRLDEDRPLIDYTAPEASPLLHFGLPRHDSRHPHPEVRGWTPAFRSVDDRRFRQAVEWIQAMHRPRPEYVLDYTPPGTAGAAPAPAGPDR